MISPVPPSPPPVLPTRARGALVAVLAALALAVTVAVPLRATAADAQSPLPAAVEKSGQAPARQATQEAAKKPVHKPVHKSAKNPVHKPVKKSAHKSVKKSVKKSGKAGAAGKPHARSAKTAAAGKRHQAGSRRPSHAGARPRATPMESFSPDTHPAVREFIDRMVAREGFDRPTLEAIFRQARLRPEITKLIAPPPPGFRQSWEAYRARFLAPARIDAGIRFMQDNRDALRRAHEQWGVPPEIVAAIIGVETFYGRITGGFRTIDALSTLAFAYPPRAAFFRDELEQFLLYTRENDVDPLSVLGSYAGAIGLPQFMPGSIRRYAVDFDADSRVDLRNSAADAIGSVAHFLADHGWVAGGPWFFDATVAADANVAPLVDAGIEPRFTVRELAGFGVAPASPVPPGMLLSLVDLPNGDDPPSYYLGTPNFYAITRYNQSSFYAMAVIELARVLAGSR